MKKVIRFSESLDEDNKPTHCLCTGLREATGVVKQDGIYFGYCTYCASMYYRLRYWSESWSRSIQEATPPRDMVFGTLEELLAVVKELQEASNEYYHYIIVSPNTAVPEYEY